jgi:hypothetical protein
MARGMDPCASDHQGRNVVTDLRKAFVDSFLCWRVPVTVCPDGTNGDPGRTGTNLLSATEAGQLFDDVLESLLAKARGEERERCAKIADARATKLFMMDPESVKGAHELAVAIAEAETIASAIREENKG